MQAFVDGSSVIRSFGTRGWVKESMVGRWYACWIISHQIGDDYANSSVFIIKQDGCATTGAGTQFQRPVRIVFVERLTIQAAFVVNLKVCVVKQRDMSRVLPRNAFTDRAVTGVAVNGPVI